MTIRQLKGKELEWVRQSARLAEFHLFLSSVEGRYRDKKSSKVAIEIFTEVVTMTNSSMKLTLSTSALAAILGLVLASVPVTLQAQTPAPAPAPAATPAPAKAKTAKPTSYSGNLTAIDATGNTITVASTAKVLTMTITPKTTILKDKKAATLADFAIGDKVTGSYTKDATGVMTAHSLHKTTTAVKTPKAPKTPAAAATPAAAPAPAAPAGQ
jgi:hypothetical protein